MNAVNPGYGKVLFDNPTGQLFVTIAAIAMVCGALTIRKIVNIRF
jgi:Flp pilus assembly protein TadB